MPEKYAARLDANGDADWVIVLPDGLSDVPAYVASLGLSGEWKDPPELPGLGYRFWDGGFYPHWQQIAGADDPDAPDDAESGYPTGYEVWRDGAARVSRVPNNVNEPLDGVSTTWSRKDGVYVVPAGWQYQPGEEVQEGGTWFRVEQATAFAPSASPSQYVELDGPGGEPVASAGEWAAGVSYAVGDEAAYEGTTYRCLQAHTSQAGWTPVAVPALWEAV